jgi:NAD(P)H-hydrate epimerase
MKPLKTNEIRKLDELAQLRFSIPGILLMEHASLGLAQHIFLLSQDINQKIFILCGKGNNGGDGFATARHLHNHGHRPEVLLMGKKGDLKESSDAYTNACITHKMGIPIQECTKVEEVLQRVKDCEYAFHLDAVFGTGLSSRLRGIYPELFTAINELNLSFIAVDVPSGLNSETGMPMGAAIKAWQTITFAFPKIGFNLGEGPKYCGEIKVVDIGLPKEVKDNPTKFL